MSVVGLSLVCNKVLTSYEDTNHASHEEVLEAVNNSGQNVEAIVKRFIGKVRDLLPTLPDAPIIPLEKNKKTSSIIKPGISVSGSTILVSTIVIVTTWIVYHYRKH